MSENTFNPDWTAAQLLSELEEDNTKLQAENKRLREALEVAEECLRSDRNNQGLYFSIQQALLKGE